MQDLDRGVIIIKAGKAAALPKFSDVLTLSQPRGVDYAHPLALPCLKKFRDYAPVERCEHCLLMIFSVLCNKYKWDEKLQSYCLN